jgi:hypothetical protein
MKWTPKRNSGISPPTVTTCARLHRGWKWLTVGDTKTLISDALTELEKRAGRPAPTEAERRIAARIVVEGNKATRTKTPKWILELAKGLSKNSRD